MGTCCIISSKTEVPLRSDPRHIEVRLSARKQSHTLSGDEAEAILQSELDAVVQRFRAWVAKLVEKGPHDEQRLERSIAAVTDQFAAQFKSQFLEKRRGEFVALTDIHRTEDLLRTACTEFAAAAVFANRRRSYEQCTSIAEELMKQYEGGKKTKRKTMVAFHCAALGPMADVCERHLQALLVAYQQSGEAGMLELRQKQLRREQRVLKKYQTDAEQKCCKTDIWTLCGNCESSRNSEIIPTSPSLCQGLSVLEVIKRLPSVDFSDSGRRSESASLTQGFEHVLASDDASPELLDEFSARDPEAPDTPESQQTEFVMKNSQLEEVSDSKTTRKTATSTVSP